MSVRVPALRGSRPLLAMVIAGALSGCGGAPAADSGLRGTIAGDGSSTVFPIMEAVAEEFGLDHPGVEIQVGESGTGGGFEKFCSGETDFSNASREIKDVEKAACAAHGVEFTEFKVASDGIAVVSNKDLDIDCLSVDELKRTFAAGSDVETARDIRAGFSRSELRLFTPGADSGTYDFFLEEVLGKDGKFRSDGVTTSEDDNVLVTGIEGSKGGLGFFGFAYYRENAERLRLIGVDSGNGCVKPSDQTILDGTYTPLSRPLFVYVRTSELRRPEVTAMVEFVLTEGRELIEEVGYVPLTQAEYDSALQRLG